MPNPKMTKVTLIRHQPDDRYVVKQIDGQVIIHSAPRVDHRAGDHITEAQAIELGFAYQVTVKDR